MASASVPTIRIGRQIVPCRRIRLKIRRATVRSTTTSSGTNTRIDKIQNRDSVWNWRANERPTMMPTVSSEALMIRRTSSVGRSTERDW